MSKPIQIGYLAPQIEPIVMMWGVISQFFKAETFNVTWCQENGEVDARFDYVIIHTESITSPDISHVREWIQRATKAKKIVIMGHKSQETSALQNGFLFMYLGAADHETAESLVGLLEDFHGL